MRDKFVIFVIIVSASPVIHHSPPGFRRFLFGIRNASTTPAAVRIVMPTLEYGFARGPIDP